MLEYRKFLFSPEEIAPLVDAHIPIDDGSPLLCGRCGYARPNLFLEITLLEMCTALVSGDASIGSSPLSEHSNLDASRIFPFVPRAFIQDGHMHSGARGWAKHDDSYHGRCTGQFGALGTDGRGGGGGYQAGPFPD